MVRVKGMEKNRVEIEVETSDLIDAICDAYQVNRKWYMIGDKIRGEFYYGSHSDFEEIKNVSEKEYEIMKAVTILRKYM